MKTTRPFPYALLLPSLLLALAGISLAAQPAAATTAANRALLHGATATPMPTATVTPVPIPPTPLPSGSGWQIIPSPNTHTSDTNVLLAVAGTSGSDLWAVGFRPNPSGGGRYGTLAEHWNGAGWTIVARPSPGYDQQLNGVAAIASADVWAVGATAATSMSSYRALLLHWNGASWTAATPPLPCTYDTVLSAVAAASTKDVWAVGNCSSVGSQQALILHFDGTRWTTTAMPHIGQQTYLSGVVALSASNAWAVGYDEDPTCNGCFRTVVLHWDGQSWTQVPSPNVASPTNSLYAVAASASNDLWAVGYFLEPGTSSTFLPLAEHFDGQSWRIVPFPDTTSFGSILKSVVTLGASNVWALTTYTTVTEECPDSCYDVTVAHPLTVHWNGSTWTALQSPDINGTFNALTAVAPGTLWAVGSTNDNRGLTARMVVS